MIRLQKKGWDIGFFEVSPDDAKKAMDGMTEDQRTSSEGSIRNLVSEINEGRFGLSNDAWVRTDGGIYLNGKHRAQAIIRTGKTVTMVVMTVPDSDASTILRIMDCGVTRSVANVAQMVSHVRNSGIVATIASKVLGYDRDLMTCQGCYSSSNRTSQDKYVSRDAVLDYIKAHAIQLEASAAIAKCMNAEFGIFGTTGPAFVHYLVARRFSTKMADDFLATLYSGKGERSSCVDPLRRAVIKEATSKDPKKTSAAIKTASIMKAFVAWNKNEPPKRGFVSVGDRLPRI
jgi:hypothetical protein